MAKYNANLIVKFTDGTVVVGLYIHNICEMDTVKKWKFMVSELQSIPSHQQDGSW